MGVGEICVIHIEINIQNDDFQRCCQQESKKALEE
jgi:hypothetical protein